MVYIRTVAYNAEKTLGRAIESILNQTYTDFIYYVCDNGSADNGATRKIIEEYAKKDKRIVTFYNKKNHVWEAENDKCKNFAKYLSDEDLFCQLDADDEYTPRFLQECIAFMQTNDLDIVCCGSEQINDENGTVLSTRILNYDLIFEQKDFAENFVPCFQFMRTIWAHLYKAKVLKSIDWYSKNENAPIAYGGDTHKNYYAFQNAGKIGVLAKVLHKYYVSSGSVSYNYHAQRVECDQILHKCALDFLSRFGNISDQNYKYLMRIYFNAIYDTIQVIANSKLSQAERLHDICKIFECDYTKEMIAVNDSAYSERLIAVQESLLKWLLSPDISSLPNKKPLVYKLISSLYSGVISKLDLEALAWLLENQKDCFVCLTYKKHGKALDLIKSAPFVWQRLAVEIALYKELNLSDTQLLGLLKDIKQKQAHFAQKLKIDLEIAEILKKYPPISCLNSDMAAAFCSTICLLLDGKAEDALNEFLSTGDVEIDDKDADGYFLFAQNLTALADNADAYLYFKKAWASYLIDCKRNSEAKTEIDDLMQLIPNDTELQALSKLL